MYHIFLLMALIIGQREADDIKQLASTLQKQQPLPEKEVNNNTSSEQVKKTDSDKTDSKADLQQELVTVNVDSKNNGEVDALKKLQERVKKQEEIIDKAAVGDLESLGLDIVDDKQEQTEEDDFATKDDNKKDQEPKQINDQQKVAEDVKADEKEPDNNKDIQEQKDNQTQTQIQAQKEEKDLDANITDNKPDLPQLKDSTNSSKVEEKNKTEPALEQKNNPPIEDAKSKPEEKTQNEDSGKNESIVSSTFKKASNLINIVKSKTDQKDKDEEKKEEKDDKEKSKDDAVKKEDKDVKEEKKDDSKESEKQKELEERLERKRAEEERKQAEKLEKLNRLREEYITKSGQYEDEEYESEYMRRYSKMSKIVPKKKELPRFVNYDIPQLLLNRYQGYSNRHHPIILTYKEKVDLMFQAISEGREDDFNALYKLINQPNIKNDQGDTLLTFSVLLQKYAIIASLLSNGADPDIPNKLGYTPLNIAIELLDYKSVVLLIDLGANINFTDALGRSYLMQAARIGSLPIADLLVSKGVDVNLEDNNELTALDVAYRYNKEIVAEFLIKKGAKRWHGRKYREEEQSLIDELWKRWD